MSESSCGHQEKSLKSGSVLEKTIHEITQSHAPKLSFICFGGSAYLSSIPEVYRESLEHKQ
jgi:hypothetical protein